MKRLWATMIIMSGSLQAHAWADSETAERELMLGLGVTGMPEYEGGKDLRVGAVPLFVWRRGRFNFDGALRYDFLQAEATTLSAGIGYDDGRRDKRTRQFGTTGSAYLAGMGRIDGAATVDLRASRALGNLVLSLDVTRWLGADHFTTLEFGAEHTTALSDRLGLVVATYGTWINSAYAQSWFGVSPSQSSASGFAQYSAAAGMKSVRAEVSAAYFLTPRWALVASVSDSLLLGDASRSPVVQARNAITTTLGFTYRFY